MSCFIVESGVALATFHLHVNLQTLKIIGGENNDDGDVNDYSIASFVFYVVEHLLFIFFLGSVLTRMQTG